MIDLLGSAIPLAADESPAAALSWFERNREPLIITGVAVVLAFYVSTFVARKLTRQIADDVARYKATRTIGYIVQFLALAVIGATWAKELNVTLWIGLAAAGVTLALQTVILGIAGWIHITLRRPFDIGDRIQIGKVVGDVLDIRLSHTCVLEVGNWVAADQSTGRLAFIPNSFVFTESVFNYTQGFSYIWNELPILVTAGSDWRLAQKLLQDIAAQETHDLVPKAHQEISRAKSLYPILYEHLTPTVYVAIESTGVLLTLRYLTEVRARRQAAAALTARILDVFAREPTVKLAFPGAPQSAAPAAGPGSAAGLTPTSGAASPPAQPPPIGEPPPTAADRDRREGAEDES
jgi:small-conductance mechanosensitive channel